jgi:hypothetical protein
MKNWKSLFVRGEETNESKSSKSLEQFSFPVENSSGQAMQSAATTDGVIDQAALNEVLAVYEKGVESINMPGYDFYEFYKAVSSIGASGDQVYNMAFQMARSMDSNVSVKKLITDAEFYISKINEVHNQYTMQGQQKISSLEAKKNEEKSKLTNEIEHGSQQVNQLRIQLQNLESDINQKRIALSAVDTKYQPQESSIRQKLIANDSARQISVMKLTSVKEGIQRNIKQ